MLNKAILMGRLTRDPELRHTQSNMAVASFTLAIDRDRKDANGNRQTDFHRLRRLGPAGRICEAVVHKGHDGNCGWACPVPQLGR